MEDLRLTAEVSDVYNDVIPELSSILRNSVTTLGTLEGREQRLSALLGDVSQLSGTAQTFLEDNGDNLIRLSELGPQQLSVLARYAPEYPCCWAGSSGAGADQGEAFRDFPCTSTSSSCRSSAVLHARRGAPARRRQRAVLRRAAEPVVQPGQQVHRHPRLRRRP